jgi:RNA polymerase sigma factor (sigma-70 family)
MAVGQQDPVLRFIRNLAVPDCALHRTDSELLRSFLTKKDQDAFAALVQRHGAMVLRACRNVLHNEHDAEDAFQATFLVLSHKAASVQKHHSLGSWLFGVAQHVAKNLKRTRNRQRIRERRAGEGKTADPLADLSVREAQAILYEELNRLPEKYRSPLVLCTLEGLTRDEAARQLGWPLQRLKNRLEWARKRLRERLRARGLGLSSALIGSVFWEPALSTVVPPALFHATTKVATQVATGGATSVVSARVAALTEGVIKAMFLSKLKSATVFLASAMLCLAAGLLTYNVLGQDQLVVAREAEQGSVPVQHPLTQKGQPKRLKQINTVEPIADLTWSPDGSVLAGVGGTQINNARGGSFIRLWNTRTGKAETLAEGKTEKARFLKVRFSPDGTIIGATAQGTRKDGQPSGIVYFWDVRSKKKLSASEEPWRAFALAFSPDSKTVAVTSAKAIMTVRNAPSGRRLRRTLLPNDKVYHAIAFSPDGRLLALGGAANRVWLFGGQSTTILLRGLKGLKQANSIRFTPDSKRVIAGGAGGVCLWDVSKAADPQPGVQMVDPQRTIAGNQGTITCLDISPDGKTLALGTSLPQGTGKLLLYDVATGKQLAELPGHGGARVHAMAFSPDGLRLASSGADRTITIWQVKTQLKTQRPEGQNKGRIALLTKFQMKPTVDNLKALLASNRDSTAIDAIGDLGRSVRTFRKVTYSKNEYTVVIARKKLTLSELRVAFVFDSTGKLVKRLGGGVSADRANGEDVQLTSFGTKDRWFVWVSRWISVKEDPFSKESDIYLIEPGFPLAFRVRHHANATAWTNTAEAAARVGSSFMAFGIDHKTPIKKKGLGRDGKLHLPRLTWDAKTKRFRGPGRVVFADTPVFQVDERASHRFTPTDGAARRR